MSDVSIDEFIGLLKKSQAIEPKKLKKWLAENHLANGDSAESPFPSAKHVAKALVDEGKLTRWQAKFLLSRRSQLQFGSYVLLERLGRDDFGDRYLARHATLDRKVELHLFSRDVAADRARRDQLIGKASQVAKLDHPGLVHVYDVDHIGGQYFLVVEHVEGSPLDIDRPSSMSEREIGELVRDCTNALKYAHEHGVVHGAITREDLILAQDGSVKLCNLTLETLRRPSGDEHPLQPMDDYLAISNIGLRLLQTNKPLEPTKEYEGLLQLLTLMRKTGDGILPELKQWLNALPTVDEEQLAGFDSSPKSVNPASQGGVAADSKTSDQAEEIASYWSENPVRMAATIATVILLIGGGIAWWLFGRPQPTPEGRNVVSLDREAGTRSAAVANADSGSFANTTEQTGSNEPASIDQTIESLPEADPIKAKGGKKNAGKNRRNTRSSKSNSSPADNSNKTPLSADDSAQESENEAVAQQQVDGDDRAVDPGSAAEDASPAEVAKTQEPKPKADENGEVAVKPANADPKKPAKPDDLKDIKGIGDARKKSFAEHGITTFAQIARMTPEELRELSLKFNSFGISPDDCESIVAQARELAGDLAMVDDGGPVTEGVTRLDPSSPFAKFPRRFELPPPDQTEEVKVADLVILKSYLLGLEIISPDGIARTRVLFELERDEEDKQKWYAGMKRSPNQSATRVAQFRKSEDGFHFQWLPEAAKNRNASYLKNCFIRLKASADDTFVLSLREPVKVEPLRLDVKSLSDEIEFRLEELPDVERVQVEILPVDEGDGDAELDIDLPVIAAGTPGRMLLKDREKNPRMWVEFRADVGPRMQVVAFLVLAANQSRINNATQLEAMVAQLERESAIAEQAFSQAPRSEDARKNRNKTAANLKLMRGYLSSLNQLLTQPVRIRVVATFDGYRAVLAESDESLGADEGELGDADSSRRE